MSDLLAAAAAALGTPEELVRRSAEARAAESGASVDEILAAWGGGAPAPSAPAAAEPEPDAALTEAPLTEPAATESLAAPATVIETAAEVPATVEAIPYKAPVLVGAPDATMSIVVGSVGLFLLILLVGLVGPSIPLDSPGARSSQIPFSQSALNGKELYGSLGCASCHTQMVRPVIADVGLGAVTLNDSNQVFAVRRFGPDLADVGSRMPANELEAVISGELGGHPPHDLADEDMNALVAYMAESRTTEG